MVIARHVIFPVTEAWGVGITNVPADVIEVSGAFTVHQSSYLLYISGNKLDSICRVNATIRG